MKRRILALLLLCLFVGGGGMAYAEETEAFTMETLAYDAENKTLQVTGKSGAVSGKIVTLEGTRCHFGRDCISVCSQYHNRRQI